MSSPWNTLLLMSIVICGASCAKSPVEDDCNDDNHITVGTSDEIDWFACVTHSDVSSYNIPLSCDDFLNCGLELPRHLPKKIRDLDTFANNCINSPKALWTDNLSVTRDREAFLFIELQNLPSRYFCKYTNKLKFNIYKNVTATCINKGFINMECITEYRLACCICNIRHLIVRLQHLPVVKLDYFCGFSKLDTLDLRGNHIAEIDIDAFTMLPALQNLDLSMNQLKNLSNCVFSSLTNLANLNLSNNHLNKAVFQALPNMPPLKVLDLSFNNIAGDLDEAWKLHSCTSNGTLCNGVSFIVELHLKKITSLRMSFSKQQKLEMIDDLLNEIRDIANGAIEPLEHLEAVDLSQNQLASLPNNLFTKYVHLKKLNLEKNQLTSIPNLTTTSLEILILNWNDIGNITASDKESLCQLANLKYLEISNNKIQTIVPHAFDCNTAHHNQYVLRFIDLSSNQLCSFSFADFPANLVELSVHSNQIQEFPVNPEIFHRPMSLKKLNLKNNLLTNFTDVALPPNLETLDLSENAIEVVAYAKIASGEYIYLQLVNLNGNNLETVCPLYFHNFQVKWLVERNPLLCECERRFLVDNFTFIDSHSCLKALDILSSNSTVHLVSELEMVHQYLCDYSPSTPNCQCNLHSSYSAICNLPCPEGCTCYIDRSFNKYLINCSGQNLRMVQQLPVGLSVKLLLALHLSSNHLTMLDSSSFASFPLAVEVHVKNNKLREIRYDVFQDLPNLQVLNLEKNLLEELPSDLFVGLTKLTELHLAQNRLVDISDEIFQPLLSLQMLDLQGNSLNYFNAWKLKNLTNLSYLKLSHNPWSCDCKFVWRFREWLQAASYLVHDRDNLSCIAEDDTDQTQPHYIMSTNFSYCYDRSRSLSVTTVWTSVVAAVVFLITCSVLLFIYRREMQVIIYSRYGLRLFHQSQEASKGKVYDAFLAYSSDDTNWIVRNLIPGLEQIDLPYKLCIHERDFLAGEIITNNILAAIKQSRTTVVILSPNFVRSQWCVFEFKSAHAQMISDPCSRIIVILLGDVPSDIDPEILLYLKTNTYLKWGDKLFWKKLYFALPNRTVAQTKV